MSEHISDSLMQPSDVSRPNGLHILNSSDLYSSAGLPLFARSKADYNAVGGLRLEPYTRGDSPSRDKADIPYNATWFDHLREKYSDSLKLLETIRRDYAGQLTEDGVIDSQGILDVYHMGVNLPLFLLWRGRNPVKNGEIPPEMATLRQALLGVGTVILHVPEEDLSKMTGKQVADIAEREGHLVGEGNPGSTVPPLVCPASPEMIGGLSQALINGNEKRGTSTLLDEYEVDIQKLRAFARFMPEYQALEEELMDDFTEIVEREPDVARGFVLQKPKTKVELFDEIVAKYGTKLDQLHPGLYEALERSDELPPRMNVRRLYSVRMDLVLARIRAFQSDDPSNQTREVLNDLEMMMQKHRG